MLEIEIGRIVVGGQPGQKFCETSSQSMAGHGGAYLSSPLHIEAQIDRSWFRLA
jgi:hypothetical protein